MNGLEDEERTELILSMW